MIKKRIQESFVKQQDSSDCGVASLVSIARYYGGQVAMEIVRELSGTSRDGTTLMGLYQAAEKLGFVAEGLEAESIGNLRELQAPAILHVVQEDQIPHYVVFYGFTNENTITVGDPAKGIVQYTVDELKKIWLERTLLKLTPNEGFTKNTSQRETKLNLVYQLIKDDLTAISIALTIGVIVAVLELSTAIFSQKLIDDILPSENKPKLLLSLFLVFILLLSRSGLSYLRGLFVIQQGKAFNNRIVSKFYGSLIRLPKMFFDTRKTGELIARLNDTGKIQTTLNLLAGDFFISILVLITSTTLVFIYSWAIGCTILMIVPVFTLLITKFNKPIVQSQKDVMINYAISEGHYIDTIQGIETIKATSSEKYFETLNNDIYSQFQSKISELGKTNNSFVLLADIISVIFITTIFGAGSLLILEKQFRIGELVAIISISTSIIPSISQLIIVNMKMQEARIAFDRMFDFLSIEQEAEREIAFIEPDTTNDLSISITELSFRYIGREPILRNISLEVKRGEIVVLMGESGGGKSTLLQILQKFYDYESGAIKVNGILLNEISLPYWRRNIGVIPQEIKIFNSSLLFNLTLNDDTEAHQQAIKYCIDYGLDIYFRNLPQGYNTVIGEEGINLSGGQKQLLAFARVLFQQPKLLILDEATSAMDRKTENFILSLIHRLKHTMTILFVTHRLEIIKGADRVYALENGKTTIIQ